MNRMRMSERPACNDPVPFAIQKNIGFFFYSVISSCRFGATAVAVVEIFVCVCEYIFLCTITIIIIIYIPPKWNRKSTIRKIWNVKMNKSYITSREERRTSEWANERTNQKIFFLKKSKKAQSTKNWGTSLPMYVENISLNLDLFFSLRLWRISF